ncbi:MAG: NADH-quinone oxidoreductase subunit L [Myxococcota bacterium]
MSGATHSELLRWIPLLPLITAAFHGVMLGVLRRPASRWLTIGMSCGSVLLSFLISCMAFASLLSLPPDARLLVDELYTWIGAGVGNHAFSSEVAFRLDPLSAVMALVVTGVGSLIHIYSVGYMADDHREDKGFQRFFCYLNLFTFSMLLLVLADNLVLMFVGWEGVGLCSYLLIGFWYSDRWNAYCGTKAFVVNRIGDFGVLVGIFLLFAALADAGTPAFSFLDIERNFEAIAGATLQVPAWLPWGPEWGLVNVVALCFFLGAVGKSAQIPLYVWLPDAMAGPTPVSALIHAATMVTAGVYLVCRLSFLYAAAPEASAVVAWVGALTALVAATIAVAQTDIKKVLAYSTVSQLGYMFLAAGCGAYDAAIFHLGTHAFFKALLFLGAGAVILAMHHEQEIGKMGGLARRIPRTHMVFLIGVLAIIGCPGFAGFFSKDSILVAAWASHVPGHAWLWRIGVGTAVLTAFYMFRLHFLVFYGKCRAPAELRASIADPAKVVIYPLYVLAFFATVGGLAGLPQAYGEYIPILGPVENSNSLANFLAPVLSLPLHDVPHSTEYRLGAIAVAAALLGTLVAWWLYVKRTDLPGRLAHSFSWVHRLLLNKYYVDEVYDAALVRPLVTLSDRVLFRGIDAGLIDKWGVNGTARTVRALAANGLKYVQSGLAQGYLFVMMLGTIAIVAYLVN